MMHAHRDASLYNDHIFFRIRQVALESYNKVRATWNEEFAKTGLRQSGGRLWFEEHCPIKEEWKNLAKIVRSL
jgi:hypothetical protein